jgi:biotin-(acetyl-CoA carboxylase) ligase
MQLVNVLVVANDVYVLAKCVCGMLIRYKRDTPRITCVDCGYSIAPEDLKDLKPF